MYFFKYLPVTPEVVNFTLSNATCFFLCQRTPLHIAVEENKMDTVECLVKKGADINIKDDGGVSILVRL